MKVFIKEVSTRAELKKFVTYPNKLYKGNAYYVPPLISSEVDTLDKNKNHAFEYCESRYWVALDEKGKIVGRIAGIINHLYNKHMGEKYIRFGWLDFIDNQEVVDALFQTVEQWAKEQHADYIDGPLGLLEFDISGVLVEGFDEIPTAYGKYNAPYYSGHIERLGYTKETDWVEYQITVPHPIPEKYARMAVIASERNKIHLLDFHTKKELMKYADQIFELMNKAYRNIHGYSELSKNQIEDLKNQFVPMLNLKYVSVVLNENDQVVGFGICIPSVSKALQKCHGRLFPFGFIHLMRALRKNDVLDSMLIGIDDRYKDKGVNALLFNQIGSAIEANGIKYVESTRELESNFNVQNLWNKMETRMHKRARCYIKTLKKE